MEIFQFLPHDTISISCFVLKQFSVSKAFQLIDIFFPLSKLLTQLSSMLTRSQCWQKLPSSRPPPICPPHAGMTQRVTRPSSSPITIDFTKQQFIRQYPGGVMVGEGRGGGGLGNGGVCVWENVSQDIVPISTNTQSHLSLLMDCLTYPHCSPQNRIWTIATPINKTVLSHGCTLKCETSEASEMHLELLTSDVVNVIQSWLSKYHAIIQSVNKNDMHGAWCMVHGAGWFW